MTRYIYETITPDGYHYIGQHTWKGEGKDPQYVGSGFHVRNFSHRTPGLQTMVLQYCDTKEELNASEIFWIEETRRIYGKRCINICDGGESGPFEELWEDPEFRERQAEANRKLWEDPEFRKHHAEVSSSTMQNLNQDPEFICKRNAASSATLVRLNADPEFRKALYANPKYIEKQTAASRN